MGQDTHHVKALHKEDLKLELDFPDSIYDVRLFLTGDGRKRGLWIWLEEAWKERVERDGDMFQEGLKRLVEHLKKEKIDFEKVTPEQMFMLAMNVKMYFDYAFGHRTEAQAIRLDWNKVKKLEKALHDEHAAEKDKAHKADW